MAGRRRDSKHRVLRRGEDGNCIFLKNNRCRVYQNRPHICRTYPFMLDGAELIISECPGCSNGKVTENAGQIAKDLLRRRDAEDRELEKTEKQYQKHSISTGSTIVFDSNGAHEYSPTRKKHDRNTYCRNCPRFAEKHRRSP